MDGNAKLHFGIVNLITAAIMFTVIGAVIKGGRTLIAKNKAA